MAEGIKISEMEEAVEVNENTYLPVIQDGVNKKCKTNSLIKEVYSTQETVVGKWIDGKTLYRKCYSLTAISRTWMTLDSNLKKSNTNFIKLNAVAVARSLVFNVISNDMNDTLEIECYNNLSIRNHYDENIPVNIIIEYTKK